MKPSNVLINKAGQIKLCDFGIAGQLVNSLCKTNIGCKPYLAVRNLALSCHGDNTVFPIARED